MDEKDILEKIDIIRQRMNITYQEARDALERAGGDLIEALVSLEEERGSWTEKISGKGEEMIDRLKNLYEKGTATKIRLKKDEQVLFELPAGAGVLGVAGMLLSSELAILGAVGTVTALLNNCTLEIDYTGKPPANGAESQNREPDSDEPHEEQDPGEDDL
jgi:hypothetical protein